MRVNAFRQSGASLTEVLVAITIFSVGLLGLLGVHATSMSNMGDSKYRADAALLADRLINEIWVNRANVALYAYSGPTSAPTTPTTPTIPITQPVTETATMMSPGGGGGETPAPAPSPSPSTSAAAGWLAGVQQTLPGGDARVAVAGSTVTVTVLWRPSNGVTHQHVAVTTIQEP